MDQAQQLRNVIKLRDQNNQKVEASQMARVVSVSCG